MSSEQVYCYTISKIVQVLGWREATNLPYLPQARQVLCCGLSGTGHNRVPVTTGEYSIVACPHSRDTCPFVGDNFIKQN